MKFIYCIILLFLLNSNLYAQIGRTDKSVETVRIDQPIKIDGELNEASWEAVKFINGFTQRSPNQGAPADQDTEVKILYNDNEIYLAAIVHDDSGLISAQMTARDELNNADWFGIILCPYQDGINGVGFIVTSQGVQLDTKYTAQGEDIGWDAIWDSATKIEDDAWIVEMKIPYAALRFPKTAIQTWDINFVRKIQRTQENTFWYPIDRNIRGFLAQTGKLNGISDIKSPVRLAMTPFVAGYVENYKDKEELKPQNVWGRSFNAGMDVKYGLNDAFTLDMTLIPDFGEAQSDNQVLNLSPFEVRFNENRQFFTEGTELFNKANLFYSRRAGGNPLYDAEDLKNEDEEIINEPSQVQLYNATKISGRTKKGTGLGFFNAVAAKTEAELMDNDGQKRKVQTSPLTNYNVSVIDQNLKNNSYVTLINTNVWRNGEDYEANATGLSFDLKNKKQSYSFNGNVKLSQQFFSNHEKYTAHVEDVFFVLDDEREKLIAEKSARILRGHAYNFELEKISGKFKAEIEYGLESHTFDINDLGFLRVSNEQEFELSLSYREFKPFGKFNAMGGGINIDYNRLHKPNVYSDNGFNPYWWGQTSAFWDFEVWSFFKPFNEHDYFETRTPSKYLLKPRFGMVGYNLSTDNRKKLIAQIRGKIGTSFELYDAKWGGTGLEFDYNLSDRIKLELESSYDFEKSVVGYITAIGEMEDDIILGSRNISTFVNKINASYIFNKNMNLSLRLRHYWSKVNYLQYHSLGINGILDETNYDEFNDFSLDFFNIDMVYRWRFAPGSDIFFIWKNSISDTAEEAENIQRDYFHGIGKLNQLAQRNSFSLKVVYYLDYANLGR